MKASTKKVVSAVLQEGKLQSKCSQQVAFVIRTVLAGNRRFIELLTHEGNSPLKALQHVLELSGAKRQYIDDSRIEFANGQSLIGLPQSLLVQRPMAASTYASEDLQLINH